MTTHELSLLLVGLKEYVELALPFISSCTVPVLVRCISSKEPTVNGAVKDKSTKDSPGVTEKLKLSISFDSPFAKSNEPEPLNWAEEFIDNSS